MTAKRHCLKTSQKLNEEKLLEILGEMNQILRAVLLEIKELNDLVTIQTVEIEPTHKTAQ